MITRWISFNSGRVWVIGSLLGALISGCGGGGGGGASPTADNAGTLSGVAAVGHPIVNGSISAKCTAGDLLTSTTSSTGSWQITLSSGNTLPCAVQVSGGTINGISNASSYHSIAIATGTTNVTPLTDLMVANMIGTADPSLWFSQLATDTTTLSNISQADIDAALDKMRNALNGLIPLSYIDPIITPFTATAGNTSDDMLTALQAAMTNRGITYSALLADASTPAFTTPVADFDLALAGAYAGTASAGTSSTPNVANFAGTYNLTTGTGTTATIVVDANGTVTSCSVGTIVSCSGSLTLNSATNSASFTISGNDGLTPVDTTATVTGTIDASGAVTGTYSGNSVVDGPFSGTLTGTQSLQYVYIAGYANAAAQAGDQLPGMIQIQRTGNDPCVTPPATPTGLTVTKRLASFMMNDFYFAPVRPAKYPDYIHYEVRKSTISTITSSDALAGLRLFVNGGAEVHSGSYEYFAVQAINSCGLRSSFSASAFSAAAPTVGPTLTGLSPTSGEVGAVVIIDGTNFSSIPANNTVMFNGTLATVTSSTAYSLTVTVPAGATTGPVSVTTADGSVSSPSNFTVLTPTPTGTTLTISGSVSLSPVLTPSTSLDTGGVISPPGPWTYNMLDGSSLFMSTTNSYKRYWSTADSSIYFNVDISEDTATNTIIIAVGGSGASLAELYFLGTSMAKRGDCAIGATPTCSSAGITLDRTAGTITFSNTPMIRTNFMGDTLLGSITLNGTLHFTPL